MKTIEQHLQELFIGKIIRITTIKEYDTDEEPVWVTLEGVAVSYTIDVNEFYSDSHYIVLEGNSKQLNISPCGFHQMIEIL